MATLAAAVLALLLAQYPYPGGYPTRPRQRVPVNPQAQSTDAVATFSGTFKSADKKFVTIETDEGNVMRLLVKGSTKFVRDGKNVKASDFENGEDVTVEASYDAHLNLNADRVLLGKPPKSNAKPDAKPDGDSESKTDAPSGSH